LLVVLVVLVAFVALVAVAVMQAIGWELWFVNLFSSPPFASRAQHFR
jgi:hypothetical protein